DRDNPGRRCRPGRRAAGWPRDTRPRPRRGRADGLRSPAYRARRPARPGRPGRRSHRGLGTGDSDHRQRGPARVAAPPNRRAKRASASNLTGLLGRQSRNLFTRLSIYLPPLRRRGNSGSPQVPAGSAARSRRWDMQLTKSARPIGGSNTAAWALGLTSVAFFMTALDALVVITALPAIHAGLGGSLATLEWTVNAYTLTLAAGIITAAALGDRLGPRRPCRARPLAFAVASAASVRAPSAGRLIAARAVQGLGAALIPPRGLTILASAFPPERRASTVGIWGAVGGLAIAGGPLIGGAVVQGLDWHWIFWLNVPIGLVAAVASKFRLPESYGSASRLDLPGVAMAAGAAVALAWGLGRTGAVGWGSPQLMGPLIAAAALMGAFTPWERRASEPMLPLRLLRVRAFGAANATGFMMMASLTSAALLMSQYFQLGLGHSPFSTGLRFLPWTLTPLLIAPAAGSLADKIGPRPLIITGVALQGAGLVGIALTATAPGG